MYINSLNRRYNLVEFNLYGTNIGSDVVFILELLINCPIDEFEPMEGALTIDGSQQMYAFDGFEANEWYEVGDCVKVVYVK